MVVGSYFTLNLFVSVIVDNFRQLKREAELQGKAGGAILTSAERDYVAAIQQLTRHKPKRMDTYSANRLAAKARSLTTHIYFEAFITLAIFVNLLVLALTHYQQPQSWTDMQNAFNYLFTAIYTAEAVLKLIGFGKRYFYEAWNWFDFSIVVISLTDVMFDILNSNFPFAPGAIRALRIFRIVRILRLIRQFDGIRKLFVTLLFALPSLFNIAAVLFLFVFVFAIIGAQLFGNVRINGQMTQDVNFQTFSKSFLLMFRLATGSGWDQILSAVSILPPLCDPNFDGLPNGNCGDPIAGYIFLTVYVLFMSQIIINMYIAVILENFSEAQVQDEYGFTEDDVRMFYDHWVTFDPNASQFILYDQVLSLVTTLPGRFAMPKATSKTIFRLHIPIYDGDLVHCADVVHAVIKYHQQHHPNYEVSSANLREHAVNKVLDSNLKEAFPIRRQMRAVSTIEERHTQYMAAKVIQERVRRYLASRRKPKPALVRVGSNCALDQAEFINLSYLQEQQQQQQILINAKIIGDGAIGESAI